MTLQPGQVLNNRYRIVKLLGEGGFGAVYRAWDINLNKPCAVKENLASMPEAQRQFQREARVLANLNHSNLPRVIDHFVLPEQGQYLVMDFVEGEDLGSIFRRGERVEITRALEWIGQVADALTYLHTRTPPVVHRDVKPANIRITPDGRAMLVDFGLFKFDEPSKSTTAGARAVTPGYAPPEQYGRGRTDARTDMYALAATLYFLLTGHEPPESVLRIGGRPLPMVHQLDPTLSPAVGKAIDRAMELEPVHRFQSVEEFMAALRVSDSTRIMQSPPEPETLVAVRPMTMQASVQPAPAARPAPAPVASPTPAPSAQDVRPEPVKRGWGRRIAGVLIVLIALTFLTLGGLYLLSGSGESEDASQSTVSAGVQATFDARRQSTVAAKESLLAEQGWDLVAGPMEGGMGHDAQDGLISSVRAGVDLKDFLVEAIFVNPYAPEVGSWDYGFAFRHAGPNQQFRLIVRSDRTWLLRNNAGQVDGDILASGSVPALNTQDNASNALKLVCEGDRGEFYLNDMLVAELDLSARANSGDLYLVTGVLSADEVAGYTTGFRDFSVFAAP